MSLLTRRSAFRPDFESASQAQDAKLILRSLEHSRDLVVHDLVGDKPEQACALAKAAAYLARKFTPAAVAAALDMYRRRQVPEDRETLAAISETLWAVRQAAAPTPFARPPSGRRARASQEGTGAAARPHSREEAPRVTRGPSADRPAAVGLKPTGRVHEAMKPESQPVMGVHEVAQCIKVSRQAVTNWRLDRPEFPKPIAELKSGPIWSTRDILKFRKLRDKALNGRRCDSADKRVPHHVPVRNRAA